MQVGFMITNGGTHPADMWADQTTETILALLVDDPNNTSAEAAAARQAKRDLRPKLFAVLLDHHDGTQRNERRNLKEAKRSMVAEPLKVDHATVGDQVCAVLAATPWKDHFAKPDVQQAIRKIIGQHTADVMHIERRWHHDKLTIKGA